MHLFYHAVSFPNAATATSPSSTTTSTTTSIAPTTMTTTTMTTTCSFTLKSGWQYRSTTLQEYTGVTAEACKVHCDQRPDCNGVGYNVGSGHCLLIQLGGSYTAVWPTDEDWYPKSC